MSLCFNYFDGCRNKAEVIVQGNNITAELCKPCAEQEIAAHPEYKIVPIVEIEVLQVLENAERVIRRYADILDPRECTDATIQLGVQRVLWEIEDVLKAAGRRK